MPDLIRHPEVIGFTGFSDKSENDVLMRFSTFCEAVKVEDFNSFIKQMERADFVPLGAGLRRLKATP